MSQNPVALVTGASSGIGRALALEYARRGFDVVPLARRKDRLEEVARDVAAAGALALPLACDVSVDGEIDAAVKEALERFGRLDVAIANAGISITKTFDQSSIDDYRRVFETNFFGVLRTAHAAREALGAARGRFAVVGSVSGYLSIPTLSAYNASKHAARALVETLRHEWRAAGISVTHIAPGFIESELRRLDNAGALVETRKDPIPRWLVMPTDKAARTIVSGVAARRAEVVVTGHGKAAVFLARHTPWLVSAGIRAAGSRARGMKERG